MIELNGGFGIWIGLLILAMAIGWVSERVFEKSKVAHLIIGVLIIVLVITNPFFSINFGPIRVMGQKPAKTISQRLEDCFRYISPWYEYEGEDGFEVFVDKNLIKNASSDEKELLARYLYLAFHEDAAKKQLERLYITSGFVKNIEAGCYIIDTGGRKTKIKKPAMVFAEKIQEGIIPYQPGLGIVEVPGLEVEIDLPEDQIKLSWKPGLFRRTWLARSRDEENFDSSVYNSNIFVRVFNKLW